MYRNVAEVVFKVDSLRNFLKFFLNLIHTRVCPLDFSPFFGISRRILLDFLHTRVQNDAPAATGIFSSVNGTSVDDHVQVENTSEAV